MNSDGSSEVTQDVYAFRPTGLKSWLIPHPIVSAWLYVREKYEHHGRPDFASGAREVPDVAGLPLTPNEGGSHLNCHY